MKKILVPIDFSKECQYALKMAAGIAHNCDAGLLLAHVIETPGQFYASDSSFVNKMNGEKLYKAELLEYFKEKMNEIHEDKRLSDLKIEEKIDMGRTFPLLDKIGVESRADLIVMGSKGIGGMNELLLGSIAQRMIRFSNVPVLTARGDINTDAIKHVVFATNLKPTPHYVTNEIQALVQILGAQLHLLHVNTKNEWKPYREINSSIKDFAEQHGIKDYHVEAYDDYTVLDGILHYAEEERADLIALMTHGRTEYSRLVSGSISEQVASLTSKPVWTCGFDHNQLKWYH